MTEVADWSDFVLHLANRCHVHADKQAKLNSTPAISPAIYADAAMNRLDANVTAWGAWMGIDIDNDLMLIPIDEAEGVMAELGLPYLIYSTTKATAEQPRYRILFPISRELAFEEIKTAWSAMACYFGALGPDPACKDRSRLYMAPAWWIPGRPDRGDCNPQPLNEFRFSFDGDPLDIDMVIRDWTPADLPVETPRMIAPEQPVNLLAPTRTKELPAGATLSDSPVVSSSAIEAYLNTPKGGHHTGMFRFLCAVLGRAKARGYDVTDYDLFEYAKQLDNISPIKTARERWSNFTYEINRARTFISRS